MAKSVRMAKKRTQRRYSPEFKERAVEMAMQGDVSVAEVARDLGVHDTSLYAWVSSAKKRSEGGPTFEEHEEIKNLRAQVRRLTMERDILKKTAVLFAKDEQ